MASKPEQQQSPSTSVSTLNSKAFKCCLCFHVKTGTLIYGILSVICHIILLGFLILIAIRPDVLRESDQTISDGIIAHHGIEGENFFDKMEPEPQDYNWTKDKLCVYFAITVAWIMSVLALIYGVIRNNASYLMPCFWLQVFDFCISCLTVVSIFMAGPDVHGRMRHWKPEEYPGMKYFDGMDKDFVMLLAVTTIVLVLSVKAYIMGMVWSCYRYIQLYVAARSVVREYRVDPDSEMLLPPCYDDAVKMASGLPQPPAYSQP